MSWSVFEYGNVKSITDMFGKTFINNKPVTDLHHVYGAILVVGITVTLGFFASKAIKKSGNSMIPTDKLDARNIMELFIESFYNLTKDIIGPDAKKYFPWIASFSIFIFFSNLLSLIPGFVPPTDMLNTTLALGTFSFLLYNYYGIKKQGAWNHFKHLAGPIPALAPLMLPIEIISNFARPMSLALRLMGNMAGDHMVLGIFLSFGVFAFIAPIPIMMLGTVVVIVQTTVFTILSIVYISMAVEDHH